jgi:ABC-type spermidine/putrescine transport system permease subunit II
MYREHEESAAFRSRARATATPEINALATIFLAVVVTTVVIAFAALARQERRRITSG